MANVDIAALLADLTAWTEDGRDFHRDRNLADRVLLATGWRCIPDPAHPAGAKWEFGTNPVCTVWEPAHPHAINSIDDAMGQLPYEWRICSMTHPGRDWWWRVDAVTDGASVSAGHASLSVALAMVAVKAWAHENGKA